MRERGDDTAVALKARLAREGAPAGAEEIKPLQQCKTLWN